MYGTATVNGLPITGAGVLAYSQSGPMSAVLFMLAVFTLLMAAKTIWRMAPVGGDVR